MNANKGLLYLFFLLSCAHSAADEADWAQLLSGYRFEYQTELESPRMLAKVADGTLLVTSKDDIIYRVKPPYDNAEIWVQLPGYPHGIVVREDEVYIATTRHLWRAEYGDTPQFDKVNTLPGSSSGHNSRTLGLSPKGELFLSNGISGNCSDEWVGKTYKAKERRGGLFVLDESQNRWQPYASGLRNPVGFQWHPGSGRLFATNNGPDHWGYDDPAEVMVEVEADDFFGMPWFQFVDGEVRRDHCIDRSPPHDQTEVKAPFAYFPARNAPMGIDFFDVNADGDQEAVVALRGSWAQQSGQGAESRRHPALVMVDMKTATVEPLVGGFQLPDGQRYARPVGVLSIDDRRLMVTSDGGQFEGLFLLTRE